MELKILPEWELHVLTQRNNVIILGTLNIGGKQSCDIWKQVRLLEGGTKFIIIHKLF